MQLYCGQSQPSAQTRRSLLLLAIVTSTALCPGLCLLRLRRGCFEPTCPACPALGEERGGGHALRYQGSSSSGKFSVFSGVRAQLRIRRYHFSISRTFPYFRSGSWSHNTAVPQRGGVGAFPVSALVLGGARDILPVKAHHRCMVTPTTPVFQDGSQRDPIHAYTVMGKLRPKASTGPRKKKLRIQKQSPAPIEIRNIQGFTDRDKASPAAKDKRSRGAQACCHYPK
ncbi:Hypothetical predicted protein [Podarcis lilfordi]|uniref:Uncharacterized protein n=1 Tax=Podarcis lilfordi TaxID=74358 RepID=A0AA35PE23_9SAUR|nr:Hypothetical predicted protein [Podarcis lilfordi]